MDIDLTALKNQISQVEAAKNLYEQEQEKLRQLIQEPKKGLLNIVNTEVDPAYIKKIKVDFNKSLQSGWEAGKQMAENSNPLRPVPLLQTPPEPEKKIAEPPPERGSTWYCYICNRHGVLGRSRTRPTANGRVYYYLSICPRCDERFIPGNLGK